MTTEQFVMTVARVVLCFVYLVLLAFTGTEGTYRNLIKHCWLLGISIAFAVLLIMDKESWWIVGLWVACIVLNIFLVKQAKEKYNKHIFKKSTRINKKWAKKLTNTLNYCLHYAETEGEYVTVASIIKFLETTLYTLEDGQVITLALTIDKELQKEKEDKIENGKE